MKRLLPAVLLVLVVLQAQSQYAYDNVLFKTIYIEDLCRELKANPEHIILDVRSPGEYSDTSQYTGLNIGHLKNAININIRELDRRWKELLPYKSKTIYVYCSHSQRSRRASRLLADSGFAKVVNINGGLSNAPLLRMAHPDCFSGLYESNNKYHIVSAPEAANMLSASKKVQVVDLRSDSVYQGISRNEVQNACGRIRGAIHIPLNQLESSLASLSASTPVLLVDDFGSDSPGAAKVLVTKGFTDVSVLFDGMDGWINTDPVLAPKVREWSEHHIPYYLMSPLSFAKAMAKEPASFTLVDVRPAADFDNAATDAWRNVGHIRDAVNIPGAGLREHPGQLNVAKDRMIVLYGFSGQPDVFETARSLADAGYKNVQVLQGGIWTLRWRAANLKDQSELARFVVDIPMENQ